MIMFSIVVWLASYIFIGTGYYIDVWIKTPNIGEIGTTNPDVLDYILPLRNYGYNRFHQETLQFRVKAGRDAVLFFLPTDDVCPEKDYYMIQIGRIRNTHLGLLYRKNKSAALEVRNIVEIPNLLNEYEYRPFWLNLGNNTIRFGRGTINDNDTLIEEEDIPPFNIISVFIFAVHNIEGFWKFAVDARPTGYFSTCDESNIRAKMSLIDSMVAVNKWQCPGKCLKMNNCLGFNYHSVDRWCELVGIEQFIVVQRQDDGWMFYRKCLQHFEGCLCD